MATQEILIAGAGPVGLSLAVALTRRGLPVRVFEALPSLAADPRGSTWHPPTLELFDAWGLAEALIANGVRAPTVQYWERQGPRLIAELDYAVLEKDTPFPFRLQAEQAHATRALLRVVEASGLGRVDFSHRVVAARDDGMGVQVTVDTPDGSREFRGAFLCGADGAHSTVRHLMGVAFEGLTYADRWLLMEVEFDFARIFPGLGAVGYIFDPREWVLLLHLPGKVRLGVPLARIAANVEGDLPSEEAVRERLDGLTGTRSGYVLQRWSVWSAHQRVAERFRHGRIVLLGDAAHVNNPTGGMGMNSGIHDAALLADCLVAGYQQGAPDALLDKFDRERHACAVEYVQRDTHRNALQMQASTPDERAARNRELRDIAADPVRARAFLRRASMLDATASLTAALRVGRPAIA